MEHLPWLIVWGPWVWKGVLVVLVVLSWFALQRFSSFLCTRRARKQLARLGESGSVETAKPGTSVTLTGVLKVGGELIGRFEDGRPAAVSTAAPAKPSDVLGALAISRRATDLSLDVEGVEVGIDGDLEVLAGSCEHVTRRLFRKLGRRMRGALYETDDETLAAMSEHKAVFRSLQPGDRVRVKGFLRRFESPVAPESYRVAGDRWVLAAQPEVGSDELAERTVGMAYEGGTAKVAVAPRLHLRRVLVAVAVWLLLLVAIAIAAQVVGGSARHTGWRWDARRGDYCFVEAFPIRVQLYSVLPAPAEARLSTLTNRAERQCAMDRQKVRQLAGLWELDGRCGNQAMTLVDHGELELAAEVARGCREPTSLREISSAFMELGLFAEASDLVHELGPSISARHALSWKRTASIHLLGGHPERAASAIRSESARREPFLRSSIDNDSTYRRQSRSLSCLADSIDARQGDEVARARLREAASELRASDYCAFINADLIEGSDRIAGVRIPPMEVVRYYDSVNRAHRHLPWGRESEYRRATLMLIAEADPEALPDDLERNESGLDLGYEQMLTSFIDFDGLDAAALARLEQVEAPGRAVALVRAELFARGSRYQASLGNLDVARTYARAAVADLELLGDEARQIRRHSSWLQLAKLWLALLSVEIGDYVSAREMVARFRAEVTNRSRYAVASERCAELVEVYLAFCERGEARVFSRSGLARRHPHLARFWAAAGAGDAELLVPAFYSSTGLTFRRDFRPLWLGRIQTHRESLLRDARWSSRAFGWQVSHRRSLVSHAWDFQVARALGDEEWESEVEPVVERLREASESRDLAIPSLVLELL